MTWLYSIVFAGLLFSSGSDSVPVSNTAIDNTAVQTAQQNETERNRRSIYMFVRRNTPYPLLDTFDWANPQIVHNKRDVTTTAPQALALINSDLVYSWSKSLAGRVIREAPASANRTRD